jgi:hypothetical protein
MMNTLKTLKTSSSNTTSSSTFKYATMINCDNVKINCRREKKMTLDMDCIKWVIVVVLALVTAYLLYMLYLNWPRISASMKSQQNSGAILPPA